MKLVCCDLWQEALTAFDITHAYRFASASEVGARSILKRRSNLPDHVKESTLQRISAMAAIVPIIPEELLASVSSSDLFNQMIAVGDIDAGEAQLALVVIFNQTESRMITGDKRFIKAMAAQFKEQYERLRPLIITFEDCLLRVCTLHGLDNIRQRLIHARKCDGTLDIALGYDGSATQDEFIECLKSYQAFV